MDSNFQAFTVTNILGICCLTVGLLARLGYLKIFFITKNIPGIYPRNTVYALMPIGVFFLSFYPIFLWAGEKAADELPSFAVLFGLMVFPVVLLFWQPRWLKPAWLRWMEDNYGHVLEEMFEEARRMGGWNWEAQVRTQSDLEIWADNVAQKHGWQRR